MSLSPYSATETDRLFLIEQIIRNDPGLAANVSEAEIDQGVQAALGMLDIITEALDYVKAQGGAQDGISEADVVAINDYIRADADLLARFTEYHGDDENGVETGYHLVQGDGATTRLFRRNAVNTVLDGIFHIGFEIEDGRFVNEDGNANASVGQVADWLTYFVSDLSDTGTGLDRLTDSMLLDPGLMANVRADELTDGVEAANAMNRLIVDAINNVAADALADGSFDVQDVRNIVDYLVATHYEEFVLHHGDDENGIETGFHLIQGDGGTARLYGRKMVNTVADGLYHLGLGMNETRTRLINEDGNQNAGLHDITVWLNGIMFDTAVIRGSNDADTSMGTGADEQIQGADGHDVIHGGAGDDTIYGGNGRDVLFGDEGDDVFIAGGYDNGGVDQYFGGEGFDVIDASGHGGIQIGGTFDASNGVEQIVGNGNSRIQLNGASNVDLSSVELVGVSTLRGSNGSDRITGSAADELILGNGGGDWLNGGLGDDTLTGEGGHDTFVFEMGGGHDLITDFGSNDRIRIHGYDDLDSFDDLAGMISSVDGGTRITFSDGSTLDIRGASAGQMNWADFVFGADTTVINGTNGNDSLMGTEGADMIFGGRSGDRIDGGAGDDTLHGGGGSDTFVFASGNDHDTIMDYNLRRDKIVLQGFDDIASFADVRALMVEVDGDVQIDFGDGDMLELNNRSIVQLNAGDFDILA